MKRPLWIGMAVAAAFAGGLLTGRHYPIQRDDTSPEGGRRLPVAVAGGTETRSLRPGPGGSEGVRPYQPGRPFARGQGKYWLLKTMASLKDGQNDPILMGELATEFLTMDRECAQELSESFKELLAGDQEGEMKQMMHTGLGLALYCWSRDDSRGALEFIRKSPGVMEDDALELVFAQLGTRDPAAAEAALADIPEKERKDALRGLLESLMRRDPEAALEMAKRHPDSTGGVINDILAGMMAKDPTRAAATAAGLLQSNTPGVNLGRVISPWLQADPAAAQAWVESYQGPGRDQAYSSVLNHKLESDPATALAAFDALPEKTAAYADLTDDLAAYVYKTSTPAAAGAWAQALPVGPLQTNGIKAVAEGWVESDAVAASEWISRLPAGDSRNTATVELIEQIQRREPAAALEWANSITNENMRNRTSSQVLKVWEEQDPEAAARARQQ